MIRLYPYARHLALPAICVGLLLITLAARPFLPEIPIGKFSAASVDAIVPEGWEEIKFGKTESTLYRLIEEEGRVVMQAKSEGTASGLIKEVNVSPEMYPMLHWEWKIDQVLSKGDVLTKQGDDYPARIYVTFDYDPKDLRFGERLKYRTARLLGYKDIPLRAISYIWSNKTPIDTIVPNAYTDWVAMISVECGNDNANTWQMHQRNVMEDYYDAFGEYPGDITGIAIMTDTDNTGEATTAYFGDITLHQ